MDSTIYCREDGLVADIRADDWFVIRFPGDQQGVALDPVIAAIWSAAEGSSASVVARKVHIPIYLASCALAVLRQAGLLQAERPVRRSQLIQAEVGADETSISVLILHRYAQGDLDACVDSLKRQRINPPVEIRVVATDLHGLHAEGICLIECKDMSWTQVLVEQLSRAEGESVLLLDSRTKLGAGALSEMARSLRLRNDIAAVAPRVTWDRWPRFVVRVADSSGASNSQGGSYTGQLDVGQFKRWGEVPSIHVSAGLLRREAIQSVEMSAEIPTPDRAVNDWSDRARLQGYHILAAMHAVAYGPWSDGLPDDATTQTLHQGMPALTVENVRGLYSHYEAITPLSFRRRTSVEPRPHDLEAFEEASHLEACWGAEDTVSGLRSVTHEPTPLRALPGKAWRHLRQQGLRETAREIRRYIRWKVGD